MDYENVKESGLSGVEYLLPSDYLCVFYSKSTDTITKKSLNYILNSCCKFETYKLINNGNNALDFYIASEIGRVFGLGKYDKAVIISKDKGYQAVQDYWRVYGNKKNSVGLFEDLKSAMMYYIESSVIERSQKVKEDNTKIKFSIATSQYIEQNNRVVSLEYIFKRHGLDTNLLSETCKILKENKGNKECYLEFLRKFGKDNGLKIYRIVKEMVTTN